MYSMDCSTPLEEIISRCKEKGVNCIALADHGTVEGGLKMQEIAPFKVIVAEEILTPYGEIMGMFLKKTIPSHISVEQALSEIKAQNGLVCIPHPFDRFRKSALDSDILEQIKGQVDIIEIMNARVALQRDNTRARTSRGIMGSSAAPEAMPTPSGNWECLCEHAGVQRQRGFSGSPETGHGATHRTNPLAHFGSSWSRVKSNFKKNLHGEHKT
jgi:hypothetical protein